MDRQILWLWPVHCTSRPRARTEPSSTSAKISMLKNKNCNGSACPAYQTSRCVIFSNRISRRSKLTILCWPTKVFHQIIARSLQRIWQIKSILRRSFICMESNLYASLGTTFQIERQELGSQSMRMRKSNFAGLYASNLLKRKSLTFMKIMKSGSAQFSSNCRFWTIFRALSVQSTSDTKISLMTKWELYSSKRKSRSGSPIIIQASTNLCAKIRTCFL